MKLGIKHATKYGYLTRILAFGLLLTLFTPSSLFSNYSFDFSFDGQAFFQEHQHRTQTAFATPHEHRDLFLDLAEVETDDDDPSLHFSFSKDGFWGISSSLSKVFCAYSFVSEIKLFILFHSWKLGLIS